MIRCVDFVVGKKYLFKSETPSTIYTCIAYTSDKYPVFESETEYDGSMRIRKITAERMFASAIEYKEPKKGVVWVNIYADGSSISFKSLESANRHHPRRIARIEVPWVEEQGL